MTTAEKTEIAKRACTIIFANEGDYGSVNANDNGAVSIGKIQWHGDRAKSLLKTICKANSSAAQSTLGTTLYNEIMSAKSWSSRIVNSTEASKISALLNTVQGKKAQDNLAISDVLTYIDKGISYGLTNAEALIYFADGVNQYGVNSTLWKTIAQKSLTNGGTLDAIFVATKLSTTNYLSRRTTVYEKLKSETPVSSGSSSSTATNNNVMSKIQKWLNNYCAAGLTVDGLYGPLTKRAMIKALQHYMNIEKGKSLSEDGIYGPLTSTAANCLLVSSKVNSRGNLAYIAQAMLYGKKYNPNGFDGEFGPGATAATKLFQSKNGLIVDGEAGPKTFAKLVL